MDSALGLLAGERVIGLIDVFDKRPRDYGDYLDFVKSVGRLAAGAIENVMLLERLQSAPARPDHGGGPARRPRRGPAQ